MTCTASVLRGQAPSRGLVGADRPSRLSLIHPGTVCAGSVAVCQARVDEVEARRGVLCCAETLAMAQCRKWLTKWRLKSADLSIMRDSHMESVDLKV